MSVIKPISDLRNNFASISLFCKDNKEPVFLTKNGYGDMVIMSLDYYEEQLAIYDINKKLEEAELEFKNGSKGKNYREVLNSISTRINEKI